MATSEEPRQLTANPLDGAGGAFHMNVNMFNAGLTYQDERDSYHALLAEALPQLGTDSWQVFPDGQMETTYRLKPNLSWHDGTALSADDFVFAVDVYSAPQLGNASAAPPMNSMASIMAPDARTVLIRWRRPFVNADRLVAAGGGNGGPPFPPLPRHILERSLQESTTDGFLAQPFWTTEYVGLGPFRLENWERGAFLEASAFAGYALGTPKIQRIRVMFQTDTNTIVANLLAGTVDMTADNTIDFDQGLLLRQQWEAREVGVVTFFPKGGRRADVQFDPERLKTPALLDVRVRRALAHAIDKDALNQGLFQGLGQTSDTWVYPYFEYFPDVDRAIAKYPHDAERAVQLLAEAGYTKGSDGSFVGKAGERLQLQIDHAVDSQYDREAAILADGLKRLGIDVIDNAIPRARQRDPEVQATFPSLSTNSGNTIESMYGSAQLPTPQNRYTGKNRGSWLNASYDRLLDAFSKTLDRSQRNGQLAQIAQIISEDIPSIPLYYNVDVLAYVPALQGPTPAGPDGAWWNMHTWELH
jgi:peptide/nickel transport system substrate-binding protein